MEQETIQTSQEERVAHCWFALVAAEHAGADDTTLNRLCRAYLDAAAELALTRIYQELQQSA